jgi:hypothetical protein
MLMVHPEECNLNSPDGPIGPLRYPHTTMVTSKS